MAAYRAPRLAAGAASVLAAVLTAPAAPASTGVGIGTWPVCSTAPVQPGSTVPLSAGGRYGPPAGPGQAGIDVVNTGDSPETVTLRVAPLPPGPRFLGGRPVDPAWVTFTPSSLSLGSGQQGWSQPVLRLPAGAPSGAYAALVIASASPGAPLGGVVAFGAAAGTPLLFLAGQSRPPASWPPIARACWDPLPGGSGALAQGPVASSAPQGSSMQVSPGRLLTVAAAVLLAAALAGRWRRRLPGRRDRRR